MYNNHHHSQGLAGSQGTSNSSTNTTNSNTLPPLILNARLHELVIAGTGQNERLEPTLEHVRSSAQCPFYKTSSSLGTEQDC